MKIEQMENYNSVAIHCALKKISWFKGKLCFLTEYGY